MSRLESGLENPPAEKEQSATGKPAKEKAGAGWKDRLEKLRLKKLEEKQK